MSINVSDPFPIQVTTDAGSVSASVNIVASTVGPQGPGNATDPDVSALVTSGAQTGPAVDTRADNRVTIHSNKTTGVHGVGTGAVVGTTATQTLTNKTLDSTNTIQGEAWRNLGDTGQPTLQNSWVNYGSPFAVARFAKHAGLVLGEGVIKSGTTSPGTVLYILPAGYRPSANLVVAVPTYNGTAGSLAALEIRSTGEVVINFGGQSAWLSTTFSFRAEA